MFYDELHLHDSLQWRYCPVRSRKATIPELDYGSRSSVQRSNHTQS